MDCNKHLETWYAAKEQPSATEGIRYAALAAADALETLAKRIESYNHDPQSRDNIASSLRIRYIPDWLSVALLMQTATLAAESLGLGMCYIGGIRNNPQQVIELLHLPPYVMPISGMTLGWPNAEPNIRPRLPLAAILHWETHDKSREDAALHAYDQAMIETGIYDGRQVPVPGKEGEMEEYGWLEHTARRVSRPNRVHLRGVIENQGFALE